MPRGGAGADLRPLRPRRCGAHAVGRRRRARPGDRRRDRQGPRRPLHGDRTPATARSSRSQLPAFAAGATADPLSARPARELSPSASSVEPPACSAAVREQGRRRHDAAPHAGFEVAADRASTASLRRSASNRSRSSPSVASAGPQVGILEPGLVGEQQVVHLPEAALERRRLGRAGRRPGAGMARADGKMPEHAPQARARAA